MLKPHTLFGCNGFRPGPARIFFLILLLTISITGFAGAVAPMKTFPAFSEISSAVQFWEQIYSRYSVDSAVIHDRNDLSKVYEVIRLLPKTHPNAEKINRRNTKDTIKKYQKILRDLSRGKKPHTPLEKHVFSLFTGPKILKDMAQAADNIRAQTGQKERFREGVARSGAHMARLRRIFTQRGLPADLAYLPHVESSFNNAAYSKFGAAGMWQFTRSTGKQYLKVDDVVDERRDPYLAADAATRYLKNSYNLLGTWPLALTAYNYGTAGMLRAQKAKKTYIRIYADYQEGHFGFASRNFYSEFLAAVKVAKRLEADRTVQLLPEFTFYEYVLPGYIHIDEVTKHFRITENIIRQYNPAFRPPIYSGKKLIPRGYPLRLPRSNAIRQRMTSVPAASFRSSQNEDSYYLVKRGDTAGAIAVRHKVNLDELIRLNHLNGSARIYVGQRLRIPAYQNQSGRLTPFIAANQRKQFPSSGSIEDNSTQMRIPPILTAGKKKLVIKTPVAREDVKQDSITVEPEESLSLYALWLQIDEDSLRRINHLSATDTLSPGQEIKIEYHKVSAAEFASLRAEYARETEEEFFSEFRIIGQKHYTVQKGDTLWDLCMNRFSIPLWLLQKYNSSIETAHIHPQQKLVIPVVEKK